MNSALAREVMDDECESNMKKCSSMVNVRKMVETLETFVAGAPIPIPTHAAALDAVSATSAVELPSATVDAACSTVVDVVDASADAFVFAFVDATSRIAGKTYEQAFYILMRIMCIYSLILPLVL